MSDFQTETEFGLLPYDPILVPEIISVEEASALNAWTQASCGTDQFADGYHRGKRRTTRWVEPERIQFPEVAHQIRRRLAETYGWHDPRLPDYAYGMVNIVTLAEASTVPHVDWIIYPDAETVHVNIMAQAPLSGGQTFIETIPYDHPARSGLIYTVTEQEHLVTAVKGPVARSLWMIGFIVPKSPRRERTLRMIEREQEIDDLMTQIMENRGLERQAADFLIRSTALERVCLRVEAARMLAEQEI